MKKYRVWDKQECVFLEERRKFSWHINADGSLSVSSGWNGYKEPTFEEDTDQDRYLVLWSTGLKDKNGVEIYKKDLLRIFYEWDGYMFDGIYQVGFSYRGVSFRFKKLTWESHAYNQIPINTYLEARVIYSRWSDYENTVVDWMEDGKSIFSKNIEVIGNIHENPELLQGAGDEL